MILALLVFLGLFILVFGIMWAGRVLQRVTPLRWPFAVGFGVLFTLAVAGFVIPVGRGSFGRVGLGVIVIVLIVSLICLAAFIEGRSKPSEAVDWANAHGVTVTTSNSDFVVAYVHEGHRLRLVCGIGGLVAALALSSGTGIDLKATGWVWLLSGYLVGVVWSESWLTRLPAGTQRSASLAPRRLTDYLARGMIIAQLVVVFVSVALAGLALAEGSDLHFTGGWSQELRASSPGSLQRTTVGMGLAAALLVAGVWLLQRHIVRKAQPMADPDLLVADDAVRASAVHLLSGTVIAIVLLLIITQLQMLAAIGAFADGVAAIGGFVCFIGALLFWRFFGHRGWVVARPKSSSIRGGSLERSWS